MRALPTREPADEPADDNTREPDVKFLPGGRFPADEPLIRTMESKYSDHGVTLIVSSPQQDGHLRFVHLPPDAARDLAVDLLQRAEHVDPRTPERVAAYHQQVGRPDGTWGCRCGWIQDKPHHQHVADMVAVIPVEVDL